MVSPTIRSFTLQDLPAALNLCRSAGWNQLESDWRRLIEYQPHGCFVADLDGRLVGTVTTTSYGTVLAWIGMMLVDPDFRRRGIATQLMEASLEYLRAQGVRCIKLDATPAGQPVYERLGFQPEWSFHRWLRPSSCDVSVDASDDIDGGLKRHSRTDLHAFGADRIDWLRRLSRSCICVNHVDGFGMARAGHLAGYLGPVTANDAAAAAQIISELMLKMQGDIFWDAPQPNRSAVELVEQLGFRPVRDLTRMRVGDEIEADITSQYAICDPGTG